MRDEFKDHHERRERQHGAHEVADVVPVPAFEALIVVVEEHEQGHADVGVDVGGGSVAGGDEAEQVLHGDEQEEAAEHGEDLAAVVAHVGDGEVFQSAYDHFERILQLSGDQRQVAADDPADGEKDEHRHPCIENVPEFHRLSGDGDMIQMNQFGDENRFRKSACHVCAPSKMSVITRAVRPKGRPSAASRRTPPVFVRGRCRHRENTSEKHDSFREGSL